MNKVLMTIFICICANAAFAQKLTLDTPYNYSLQYSGKTLILNSDSTFVYRVYVKQLGVYTYTGTWKRKCNLLLLTSTEPTKVKLKDFPKEDKEYTFSRKQAKRLKIPVSYHHHNSCFLIKDDETIQIGFKGHNIWELGLNQ